MEAGKKRSRDGASRGPGVWVLVGVAELEPATRHRRARQSLEARRGSPNTDEGMARSKDEPRRILPHPGRMATQAEQRADSPTSWKHHSRTLVGEEARKQNHARGSIRT